MWLLGLIVLTLLWDMTGLDMAFMQLIGTSQGFVLKNTWLLSRVLHEGLRQVMTVVWLLLCAWALWPGLVMPRLERVAVVELTRIRGHIILCVQGVANVQSTTAVPGGIPPADGRAG